MLDIKRIRENPEEVAAALKKRNLDVDFTELLTLDKDRRALLQSVEEKKNDRNITSKKIPVMKKNGEDVTAELERMKKVGDEITEENNKVRDIEERIQYILDRLPNIPADDVVAGGKENNKVIKVFGEKPSFDFEPKNHVDLCKAHNLIDYERGVKLSGEGSWLYTGQGALLEWALLNFFIREHVKDGYTFILPPHMLGYQCGYVAGQFPKYVEEDYWIDGGPNEKGNFLLPTAETALVNIHRDEILKEEELPKRYFAYTPCFRREAGSSRIEERGMVRGHQFNKVEMVQYAHPDHSEEAFDELLKKAESLVQKLGLHYQLSKLAADDCSFSMGRTCDIEVWIPSMGIYKEISSVSNGYDYQARRGNVRFRDSDGKMRFVHTLNGSGLATSRVLPAIVEQYQQADGSIVVPEVLRQDVGTDIIK
ncbi:MAG: serine--tRNA ligase [Lachnospiraceae bacterium]|nr:serine--tRNA ligase [Lachnospiraceae bacterium]MBO4462047.1 serine--tRNA ligase [Lachnospiraceae bacterium]MBR5788801.1 serine--tRNA ligase [Lachnospiraceae bacterium]